MVARWMVRPRRRPRNQIDSESSGPGQAQPRIRRRYLHLLGQTYQVFGSHHGFGLAAAMSFYAILSLAPLVVLLLSISGTVLDRATVGRELVRQVRDLMGQHAADVTRTIVEHANKLPPSGIALFVGVAMLVFGATGMFTQLQDSLNLIWRVESAPGFGVTRFLRKRLTALIMVLCVETILLTSPVLLTIVTVINARLVGRVPQIAQVWQWLYFLVSIVIITLVFAAIFKVLPHTYVWWSDVWVGAAGAAVMFTIGQFLIGTYLGHSGIASVYGAAGSLVGLLVWIYYSALIMFLGAQFTQVFAHQYGSRAPNSTPAAPSAATLHGPSAKSILNP